MLIRLGAGLVYTFVGLVFFLTGVNVGFMPAGTFLGGALAGTAVPVDIDTDRHGAWLRCCFGGACGACSQ